VSEAAGEPPALSLVVPVFNEEGNVAPLCAELTRVASGLGRSYETIFVNDGSTDETLPRLKQMKESDVHLHIVSLDGNFGEAAALCAGFAHAHGDVVVTLDGDGQNNPADIPRLLAKLDEGYDVVSGRREERKEKFWTRVLPSRVANWLVVKATGIPVYDCGCGLKAYRRTVLNNVQLPKGFNRFLPAILGIKAERVAEVMVKDRPRGSGASHYGLKRIFVVLKDLPSLPFLVRRPVKSAPIAVSVLVLFFSTSVVCVVLAGRFLSVPVLEDMCVFFGFSTVMGVTVAAAAEINIRRFVTAREQGVFRVKEVL